MEQYEVALTKNLSFAFGPLSAIEYSRTEFSGSMIDEPPPPLPQGYKRHTDAYGKVGTIRENPEDPAYTLDYDTWMQRRSVASMLALISASRMSWQRNFPEEFEAASTALEQYGIINVEEDTDAEVGAVEHGRRLFAVLNAMGKNDLVPDLLQWLRGQAGFPSEARVSEVSKSDGEPDQDKRGDAGHGVAAGGEGDTRTRRRGRRAVQTR